MAALGVPLPLSSSCGARLVPEEDAFAATVLATAAARMVHRCAILRRDRRGRIGYEGVSPPLPWSHGARLVPKEDASMAMVLADGGGWDDTPARRSLEVRPWKGRW
jgi:hypothetical protein